MRAIRIATATCALLSVVACETLESADLRTSGVHAQIEVEADGSGTSLVRTTLRSGGRDSNTYLELTDGDRLVASAAGQDKRMLESRGAFDEVHYVAGFSRDTGNTEFRVAFERPSEHGADARDSVVTLPPPFRLTSPSQGRLFVPEDDTLRIEWDRRGPDPVEVSLEGDCIDPWSKRIDEDRGGLVLRPGTLRTWGSESCRVEVTVTRVRAGEVDPNFGEGGSIEARQVRRTWLVARVR